MFTRGPVEVQAPRVAGGQRHPETPDRDLLHILDSPDSELQPRAAARARQADPDYNPRNTPRSRQESRTPRDPPPLTRARARQQAIQESNQGHDSE
jgi:hypothetical protein